MIIDPESRYLERDWGRLGYHVLDGGAAGHVIWLNELNQNVDLSWADPELATAISSLARDQLTSITWQERGVGLSDPVSVPATLEEQVDDLIAVLDHEGIERAVIVSCLATCLVAAAFAARWPERVVGIAMITPNIVGPLSADGAFGWTPEAVAACVGGYRQATREWGTGLSIAMWDPGFASPYNVRLGARAERCSASPRFAVQLIEQKLAMDGRGIYELVRAPTRVLRPAGQVTFPEEAVRAVAEVIDGATYHELPAAELGDTFGTTWAHIARHAAELARGDGALTGTDDRVLATVLFTDIVGSTSHAAAMGDRAWSELLVDLQRRARNEATKAGGRLVKDTGDGALCEFPGPAAAVRCAEAIVAAAPERGVQIRAGVHSGECERRADDLAGLAVHIAARVCAAAGPGEVLVSRTACDLVMGSGLRFSARGEHTLKGVPGTWELFALTGAEAPPEALKSAPSPTAVDRALVAVTRRAPGAARAANRMGGAIARRRLARHSK